MTAKKKIEAEPVSDEGIRDIEGFVGAYLNAYREYLAEKDLDERHLPQFYKGFPFTVDVYSLPNLAVCTLFSKSDRSRMNLLDGDYELLNRKIDDSSFDFMLVFPPFTNFTDKGAERLAHSDADGDLRESRRLELLSSAEVHLDSIHQDIDDVVDKNPWIDEPTQGQKEKLDRAKELIQELYREVDISKEERFAQYGKTLNDLRAFEKGEVEAVASELEVEMETLIEEMEGRISNVEVLLSEHGHGESSPETLENDLTILGKKMNELTLKIDGLEEGDRISRNRQDS